MQPSAYVLGHSDAELTRLIAQSHYYGELTEDIFRRAGIVEGMRVLDAGCGAGDVSFLVRAMIGPGGHVLGVDKSESAVAAARARASQAGLHNVEFQVADLERFEASETFD